MEKLLRWQIWQTGEHVHVTCAWWLNAAICLLNRGPGDFFGSRQSGFQSWMTFPLTDLLADEEIVTKAKNAAEDLLEMTGGEIPEPLAQMMKIQGFPSLDDFDI